jgi:hypothetical protein
MDPAAFQGEVQQLVQGLAGPAAQNANVLRTQAALGDQTAQAMLGFQTGMLEITNVQEQYKKSLQELNDSQGTTAGTARGLTAELQETNRLMAAQKLNLVQALASGMTGDPNLGMVEAMRAVQNGVQGFLGSDVAEKFIQGVGEGLGTAILEPFYNVAQGQIEFNDTLFFAGLGANAMGKTKLGYTLMAAQLAEGAGMAMKGLMSLSSSEIDEARQLGMSEEEYKQMQINREKAGMKTRSELENIGDMLGGDNNPLNTKIDSNSINELGNSIATGLSKIPGFAEFLNKQ